MIALIVALAGFLSIAMARACLVSALAAGLDDADTDRLRDAGFAPFLSTERIAALGFDLGLVMGSSEVCATTSAAPPQPRPGKPPAGQHPEAGLSRPKSPYQRSIRARMLVNSEQDCCWLSREAGCNHTEGQILPPQPPIHRFGQAPPRGAKMSRKSWLFAYSISSPDTHSANVEEEIAESLQPCSPICSFCGDYWRRLV
jgi:hypothetical protein